MLFIYLLPVICVTYRVFLGTLVVFRINAPADTPHQLVYADAYDVVM